MAIRVCQRCGANNRVDERAEAEGRRAVCGRCGSPLGTEAAGGAAPDTSKPKTVTDDSFAREVVAASESLPVVLDCWAPWCGPCRMIAPVLDELAAESSGRYRVAKLDVDANPVTASRFQVQSIPTLIIFKDGRPADRIVGLQPKQALAARLAAQY